MATKSFTPLDFLKNDSLIPALFTEHNFKFSQASTVINSSFMYFGILHETLLIFHTVIYAQGPFQKFFIITRPPTIRRGYDEFMFTKCLLFWSRILHIFWKYVKKIADTIIFRKSISSFEKALYESKIWKDWAKLVRFIPQRNTQCLRLWFMKLLFGGDYTFRLEAF